MMSRAFPILAVVVCALASTAAPIDIGDRREVLWDDFLVDAAKTTARRVLHRPEYAGVVLRRDKPWEAQGGHYFGVFPDHDAKGDYLRMYYEVTVPRTKDDQDSWSTSLAKTCVCYAESRDGGVTWTRPSLGLCDYHGSKDNNIILDYKSLDNAWDNFAVFKDSNPDCPPDERYKAQGAITRTDTWTLGCFLSSDGIRFREGGRLIKSPGAFDSYNVSFWDPLRKEYRLYYRSYHDQTAPNRFADNKIRDINWATSRDYRNWTPGKRLGFGGSEDYALYVNNVQPYPRAPHVYVGFPVRYAQRRAWTANYDRLPDPADRRRRMQKPSGEPRFGLAVTDCAFMMSRDGANFLRYDEAFIRPGLERHGNWVYGDCYMAYGFIETPARFGDGREFTFFVKNAGRVLTDVMLERYCLRIDGFASRQATYVPQKVVTKPLVYRGSRLTINFSTSARGYVFVTVRGADGRTAKSGELFGDAVDREVDFESGAVAEFAGKPVTLEFEMCDADLYSLKFD